MTDQVTNTPAINAPVTPPVTAPVTPPVPAPVSTPPANEPVVQDTSNGSFEPTGDARIDLALDYFAKLGFKESDPEMQEAAKGNFQYLEAKVATMGDKAKGADKYLQLAKDGHKDYTDSQERTYQERVKLVHETVGGEENWAAIQAWVGTNAEPEEKEAARAALQAGGIQAKAMASFLAQQYQAASGTTVQPASTTGDLPAPNASPAAPYSLAQYRADVAALAARVGSDRVQSTPEYAEFRRKAAHLVQ